MINNYKTLLAIDYGKKNIGLAISHSLIPEALTPLKVDSIDDATSKILKIIKATSPNQVIVGMPEGSLVEEVNSFIAKLQVLTKVPVFSHPETLSTQIALEKLRQKSSKRKTLKKDHSFAACVILEDYLDLHRSDTHIT